MVNFFLGYLIIGLFMNFVVFIGNYVHKEILQDIKATILFVAIMTFFWFPITVLVISEMIMKKMRKYWRSRN